MIGAVRAQWPGQLRAHIVEPANRQHWRWQKTFETAKPHPQWQTSSNKAILPNPSQTVPPPGDQVFRHLSQWEAVPSTLPQCVCVRVHVYVHMNDGPCRGQRCRMPWSESFRQLWAFICRYWELNSGPLQEQYTLLTTKTSLQPAQVFLTHLCVFPGCGTEVMNTFGTSNSLSSNVGSTFHLV